MQLSILFLLGFSFLVSFLFLFQINISIINIRKIMIKEFRIEG